MCPKNHAPAQCLLGFFLPPDHRLRCPVSAILAELSERLGRRDWCELELGAPHDTVSRSLKSHDVLHGRTLQPQHGNYRWSLVQNLGVSLALFLLPASPLTLVSCSGVSSSFVNLPGQHCPASAVRSLIPCSCAGTCCQSLSQSLCTQHGRMSWASGATLCV